MKTKNLPLAVAIVLFGCQTQPSAPSQTTESVKLPVEYSYKGGYVMGDMKNVAVVAECNKRISELNTDLAEFIADSMRWVMADGLDLDLPRDSAVAFLKTFIESTSSIKINFITQLPVRNTENNDEWVLSWTDETYTFKDGKVLHDIFHEDYKMENGKIRELYQYSQKVLGDK